MMDQPPASVIDSTVRDAVIDHHIALKQLERQVERGHLFEHTALGTSFLRLGEAETFLHGLLDLLLAKGIVNEDELRTAVEGVRQELTERGHLSGAGAAIGVENPAGAAPPLVVDCDKRMHICHAVCCKLQFALTIPEIESGKIKWDLGRPYFIRQEEDSYCTHNDSQTGGCRIYDDRPAICRSFSCANDKRIWKNFEKMELNVEWLESNLSMKPRPGVAGTSMQSDQFVQIQRSPRRTPPPLSPEIPT